MGMPYGSMPRKTVPRAEQATAMDFSVLWDFEVSTEALIIRHRFHTSQNPSELSGTTGTELFQDKPAMNAPISSRRWWHLLPQNLYGSPESSGQNSMCTHRHLHMDLNHFHIQMCWLVYIACVRIHTNTHRHRFLSVAGTKYVDFYSKGDIWHLKASPEMCLSGVSDMQQDKVKSTKTSGVIRFHAEGSQRRLRKPMSFYLHSIFIHEAQEAKVGFFYEH